MHILFRWAFDYEGDVDKLRYRDKAEEWNKMHDEDFSHNILEASMSNNLCSWWETSSASAYFKKLKRFLSLFGFVKQLKQSSNDKWK